MKCLKHPYYQAKYRQRIPCSTCDEIWKSLHLNLEIEKRCTTCDIVKPLADFHKNKSNKDGLSASCKKCVCQKSKDRYHARTTEERERKLLLTKQWKNKNKLHIKRCSIKWKYNLSPENLDLLKEIQSNKCAICCKTFQEEREECIDHDHTSSKVRGILCKKCNSGLGMFNDSLFILQNAMIYLQCNLSKNPNKMSKTQYLIRQKQSIYNKYQSELLEIDSQISKLEEELKQLTLC